MGGYAGDNVLHSFCCTCAGGAMSSLQVLGSSEGIIGVGVPAIQAAKQAAISRGEEIAKNPRKQPVKAGSEDSRTLGIRLIH